MVRPRRRERPRIVPTVRIGSLCWRQTLIRNYIMERFLERIALSRYRNHFILKGGMLVAAVVGLDTRATMDIDTTVRSLDLDEEVMESVKELAEAVL